MINIRLLLGDLASKPAEFCPFRRGGRHFTGPLGRFNTATLLTHPSAQQALVNREIVRDLAN